MTTHYRPQRIAAPFLGGQDVVDVRAAMKNTVNKPGHASPPRCDTLPAKIAETLHSPAISVEGGEVSGR